MAQKIKGIIFDLDGTLIDSLMDLTESVNYALQKVGLETYPPEIVKNFVGNGMRSLIENSINHLNLKDEKAQSLKEECLKYFLEHYDTNCIHHTTTYFGVEEFLQQNYDIYKFAILTNKSEYFTNKIIEHLKIKKYFSHIFSGDIEIYKKPNPEGITKIQKDWGFFNQEVLMIGDHYTDIQAAKSAGVASVFAIYGYGRLNGLLPEYSIKNFYSLKQLLHVINSK